MRKQAWIMLRNVALIEATIGVVVGIIAALIFFLPSPSPASFSPVGELTIRLTDRQGSMVEADFFANGSWIYRGSELKIEGLEKSAEIEIIIAD